MEEKNIEYLMILTPIRNRTSSKIDITYVYITST